jgi:hypothetical protein
VLWVLAVGSYWTFAHRMYHTWRELTKVEEKTANVDAEASYAQSNGSKERPKRAEVPI